MQTTQAAAAGQDLCSGPAPRHPRPDGQDRYTISEVVAFTGLTAHTLRWYERIGLMPHVDRSHTGQRRYTNRDLDWLVFVTKLRLTGMPVADMVRYAELVRQGRAPTTSGAGCWSRPAGTCSPGSTSCATRSRCST